MNVAGGRFVQTVRILTYLYFYTPHTLSQLLISCRGCMQIYKPYAAKLISPPSVRKVQKKHRLLLCISIWALWWAPLMSRSCKCSRHQHQKKVGENNRKCVPSSLLRAMIFPWQRLTWQQSITITFLIGWGQYRHLSYCEQPWPGSKKGKQAPAL